MGEEQAVTFTVHTDRLSFTGRDGRRIVEPGTIRFSAGRSSGELLSILDVEVTGEVRAIAGARQMTTPVRLSPSHENG
ncbi:hypothetical protein BH23ACT6_BH23ACT6_17010 [soil metagenome]